MVPYVAVLDVLRLVVVFLAHLLAAHRRRIGTPRGSRVPDPFRQAVLVLRWFRERTCVHCLARDAGISQATGYRYLHEGINVLAEKAPDLHQVLDRCREQGLGRVVLDGTLIACDRVAGTTERGNDLWYSGKGRHFAGNLQFLAAPDGSLLWVSEVEPGSVLRPSVESGQCTSRVFADACRTAGVRQSMSAVGSSAGNALAESFNATFKRETLQGRKGWSSEREARFEAFRWLHRYNTRRRHSRLGHRSPIAYENTFRTTSTTLTQAA